MIVTFTGCLVFSSELLTCFLLSLEQNMSWQYHCNIELNNYALDLINVPLEGFVSDTILQWLSQTQ